MDLLGVVSPSTSSIATAGPTSDIPLSNVLVPGVVAGIAGVALFPRHPVLGFLGAESIGLNAYRLYRGQEGDRARALCNIATVAAGITGSLAWKRHPVWGYVFGFVAGVIATSLVRGSSAHSFAESLKR